MIYPSVLALIYESRKFINVQKNLQKMRNFYKNFTKISQKLYKNFTKIEKFHKNCTNQVLIHCFEFALIIKPSLIHGLTCPMKGYGQIFFTLRLSFI